MATVRCSFDYDTPDTDQDRRQPSSRRSEADDLAAQVEALQRSARQEFAVIQESGCRRYLPSVPLSSNRSVDRIGVPLSSTGASVVDGCKGRVNVASSHFIEDHVNVKPTDRRPSRMIHDGSTTNRTYKMNQTPRGDQGMSSRARPDSARAEQKRLYLTRQTSI
jgi:hypothetical protein